MDIIATVLGIIVGAALTHYFAKLTTDRQELHKAGAKFRAAFLKEYQILSDEFDFMTRELGDRATFDVLSKARFRHKTAMLCFRPYIRRLDRQNFDEDWKLFCGDCEHPNRECMFYHSEWGGDDEKKKKKIALERIDKLMSYSLPWDYMEDFKGYLKGILSKILSVTRAILQPLRK